MENNDERSSKMHTIPARKTSLSEIDNTTASEFISEHHRSGMAKPGTNIQNFGLYFNSELLAVAIFCNPRTKRKQQEYTTELFRLAFKDNVRIQGGSSKLIKHFMNQPKSIDLFTYQDTSGESTNVYEYSGMTLIGEKNPTKKIAVLDGLTSKTATNNRKDWFSIEQIVKFGPDSLIGTQLGEVFENGKRVSNLDLFLRNGYHLEEIPGDRVYEWHNPKFKEKPKICTIHNINYMQKACSKCIAENLYILKMCPVHGETLHMGDVCKTCISQKSISIKICSKHGETKHIGELCRKCINESHLKLKDCSIHGLVLHQSNSCTHCASEKRVDFNNCPKHGKTKFLGSKCAKCIAEKGVNTQVCSVHGKTKFVGNHCKKCMAAKVWSVQKCSVHGESKHRSKKCVKCAVQKRKANK